MGSSDTEAAERLTRNRAFMFTWLAVMLIAQQASFISGADDGRTVDHVRDGAWLILSLAIFVALVTGGAWMQPRSVRALVNDESTRAHRAESFRVAFIAAMGGCIFLYGLSLFTPVEGRDAIHIITTIGLSAGLLSFALLERRALKDG